MNPILEMSASEIAGKIRNRELSPVEVLEAHIERIEQVNPKINALITANYEAARQEAEAAQARIEAEGTEHLPPLFGVPITIKDCWAVKGLRFTGGSWYMRDNIAENDAEAVRLLREAGAIILGKTNLPDMCWTGETVNPIFGQTNNPRNLAYSAGGSSGGEGALIAAGGSPFGLGSDIAGSVRIPAAMNGCVSLKPTGNRIPSEDHVPAVSETITYWNSAGPLARRIEDLALLLKVLSRTPVQDYKEISLKERRCVVTIKNELIPVRASVKKTVNQAADTLKNAGMAVERNDKMGFAFMTALYGILMREYGNKDFKRALGGGKPYKLMEEIWLNLRGKGRISGRVLWFATYIDVAGWISKLIDKSDLETLERMKTFYMEAIGEGGVMLTTLLTAPVPKHGWIYSLLFQPPYSTIFNELGFPAVVVPIGYNEKGLPQAIQVVACPGEDEIALAVAAELERVHGGWRMAEL